MHELWQPPVRDGGNHLRPNPHAAHGLVRCLLELRLRQRRNLGLESEAHLRAQRGVGRDVDLAGAVAHVAQPGALHPQLGLTNGNHAALVAVPAHIAGMTPRVLASGHRFGDKTSSCSMNWRDNCPSKSSMDNCARPIIASMGSTACGLALSSGCASSRARSLFKTAILALDCFIGG